MIKASDLKVGDLIYHWIPDIYYCEGSIQEKRITRITHTIDNDLMFFVEDNKFLFSCAPNVHLFMESEDKHQFWFDKSDLSLHIKSAVIRLLQFLGQIGEQIDESIIKHDYKV